MSLEALVDVAVSVIESGEPADDVERVLDAVGRFGADRPDGFDRLTGPLTKRARTILARRDSHPFSGYDPRSDVAAVLLAWAAGEVVAPRPIHSSVDTGAAAFLSARAREVAEAVAVGRPFVSVAAPTHAGGWIDPGGSRDTCSEQARRHRRSTWSPPSSGWRPRDVTPRSHRPRDLAGESGAVVRYALGGDEPIGGTAAWWVAAARVRSPRRGRPGGREAPSRSRSGRRAWPRGSGSSSASRTRTVGRRESRWRSIRPGPTPPTSTCRRC